MINYKKRLIVIAVIILFVLTVDCGKNQPAGASRIQWIYSIDSAFVLSKQTQKPVMIDFMAEWCPPCRAMEDSTFNDIDIVKKSSKFITVRIDVDKQRETAVQYNGNARKYGGVGIPNLLFLNPDNEKLKHVVGFQNASRLSALMDTVLNIYTVKE